MEIIIYEAKSLKRRKKRTFTLPLKQVSIGFTLLLIFAGLFTLSFSNFLLGFITFLTLFFSIQAVSYVYMMIYTWEDLSSAEHKPKHLKPPLKSFTALIPARFEETVIADTIRAIHDIDYPGHLKEVIILCRADDLKTISKVKNTIDLLKNDAISLVEFYDLPINKPHALNVGLSFATKEYVVVFDAEDQPHEKLYSFINDVIVRERADVVQAGVQLMNITSKWFSVFNVLEYYFWFKSILHFFAAQAVIPLGGNSVFIKRSLLQKMGGWDENCLTEDADIGVRLSLQKARIRVAYNEEYVTQEETPLTVGGFVKQRTRWNQGFLQIIQKQDWRSFSHIQQVLLAFYVLALPTILVSSILFIPFSLLSVFTFKLPVAFALGTFLPLMILGVQLLIYFVGFFEFKKMYGVKTPLLFPLRIILLYFPYQFLLVISSFRASLRMIRGEGAWEKTTHLNLHRKAMEVAQV